MIEQHLYLKGNNFITDWGKYRKKHYFCDTFVINRKRQTEPLAVMAGLTRHLPSKRDTLQHRRWRMFLRHDGKGIRIVLRGVYFRIKLLRK